MDVILTSRCRSHRTGYRTRGSVNQNCASYGNRRCAGRTLQGRERAGLLNRDTQADIKVRARCYCGRSVAASVVEAEC